MANEKKEILSRYLREEKAKRKSKSFNTLVKRLRLEQEFRNILLALKENEISFQEVLPSLVSKKKFECTPDFIIWKHDVKVPIFLIGHEEGAKYGILRNELFDYLSFLKKTDYDVIAAIWMSPPSFPCKIFKIVDIKKKIKSKDKHFVFTDVSPFKQRILNVFLEKAPIWEVPQYEKLPELEKPERLLKTFESTFKEMVRREAKRRRPRLPHRKEALRNISDEDLDKISLLFRKYFKGEIGVKDLARLLKKLAARAQDLREEKE